MLLQKFFQRAQESIAFGAVRRALLGIGMKRVDVELSQKQTAAEAVLFRRRIARRLGQFHGRALGLGHLRRIDDGGIFHSPAKMPL